MKKKQPKETSKYKEVTTYDSSGNVLTAITSSTSAGLVDYTIPYPNITNYPYNTTTLPDPSIFTPTPYPYYPSPPAPLSAGSPLSLDLNTIKEVKRLEQIKITRMQTLKEILNKFDKCNEFHEVYEIIDFIRKEYEELAMENED